MVIKSMIDNNIVSSNQVFVILGLIAFFSIRKFIDPFKTFISSVLKKDDLANLHAEIKQSIEKHQNIDNDQYKSLNEIEAKLNTIIAILNKIEMQNNNYNNLLTSINNEFLSIKLAINNSLKNDK